jgi:dienelactone hydrolase
MIGSKNWAWPAAVVVLACGGGSEGTAGEGGGGAQSGVTSPAATSGTGGSSGNISVTEQSGSYLCKPAGSGPFAAVLYNHGGLGMAVGGDLEGTCEALAKAGYVAHSKKRRETTSIDGHLDDTLAGLDALRARPEVDSKRVGIMGFSRGGYLTLAATLARPSQVHAACLMAPASVNGKLAEELKNLSPLAAPVLVLVSENDLVQDDHVGLAKQVEAALKSAGKQVELIIYPPYGNDGHELFFAVRDSYWNDVLAFLSKEL